MPIYKVELVHVTKKYSCATVEASSRMEATSKVKEMSQDVFDDTETSEQVSWETKREWNLLEFLFNRA